MVLAMPSHTPQNAPFGCPNDLLRHLYHFNRIDYCSTLVVVGLAAVTSQEEATAFAQEDKPTIQTAGEEMAAFIIDGGIHSFEEHGKIAVAFAVWILDVTGED